LENEQFDKDKKYHITMCIAKNMLQQGIITDEEFVAIELKMKELYQPLMGNIAP
jgi:mannitol/fructose-specific phosphotransferase system IIA component (Ntr-type)